jgi:long-chain acyl-CoA synthetase
VAIDFVLESFAAHADADAIVWCDEPYSYRWLLERVGRWRSAIGQESLAAGSVVALDADFSPNSVALFLALTEAACILVPLTSAVGAKLDEVLEIAQAEVRVSLDADDQLRFEPLDRVATHPLYQRLRADRHPGLVLFSSGSTGKSKGGVHDLVPLLEKFRVPRRRLRTISFLLNDHIGGINTMLYTLTNGGCLVTVADRSPDTVLRAVEAHGVELLPTSPTFINLVLLSEAYKRHRLDGLKIVTYGTEPMPESTLRRFHGLFPHIQLMQTYGLSEVGILRAKSKGSDSLWVKVGGEGFETRVVDGVLHIRARSAMLGYLNAPNPFGDDGWLNTGDRVDVDGDYVRFLGRESEILNVGGQKVFPAEVESVLQELPNVAEITVYGEQDSIIGNIVCARVTLIEDEDNRAFVRRLKNFCRVRLEDYKVPVKVITVRGPQHSARFKKVRAPNV